MNELRYVYAVTRPFDDALPDGNLPDHIRGLDGEPPRLLHHAGLVAVVSQVPADDFDEAPLKAHLENLDWLTGTARTHEAVIGALTTLTCPVPLRLATVCRDDSGVRRLIEADHDRFVHTLERLDGRIEWGVKVYADTPREDAQHTGQGVDDPPPATGRDYLRRRLGQRRKRENTWERADSVARTLHAGLSERAEAGVLHRPQDARLSDEPGVNVLNAAYLVRREESAAFIAEIDRLGPKEPGGVRVELTGPWAPYSFAGLAGHAEEGSR